MSTKNQTNSSSNSQQSLNFDPSSMGQYQNFWSLASPLLNGMATNPYSSQSYQQNLAQGMQFASQAGRNNIQNALSNFQTSGMGQANGGVKASLLSSLGRYGTNLNSQAFQSAGNQAQSNMWNALGIQAGRTPLVTGQTGSSNSQTTQTTSGLGTWLPQVAGMGVSALTSGLTGGFGGGGGQTASQNPLTQVGGSMTNFMQPTSNSTSLWNPAQPSTSFGNFSNPAYGSNPLAGLGI